MSNSGSVGSKRGRRPSPLSRIHIAVINMVKEVRLTSVIGIRYTAVFALAVQPNTWYSAVPPTVRKQVVGAGFGPVIFVEYNNRMYVAYVTKSTDEKCIRKHDETYLIIDYTTNHRLVQS